MEKTIQFLLTQNNYTLLDHYGNVIVMSHGNDIYKLNDDYEIQSISQYTNTNNINTFDNFKRNDKGINSYMNINTQNDLFATIVANLMNYKLNLQLFTDIGTPRNNQNIVNVMIFMNSINSLFDILNTKYTDFVYKENFAEKINFSIKTQSSSEILNDFIYVLNTMTKVEKPIILKEEYFSEFINYLKAKTKRLYR